jgi:tetratricopeptide (TPR) repeat protein
MKKAATLLLALTLLLTAPPALPAQPSPQETAANEAVYRQANRIALRQKLVDARAAQDRRAPDKAAKLYDDAWDLVGRIGSGVDAEREQTITGLAAVRLELARAAQQKGDYKEARTQVDDVLRVEPTNAAAIGFKSGNEKLLAEQRGTIPSEAVRSQVPGFIEEQVKASTLVHDGKLLYEMNKLEEADVKLKLAL